MDTQNKPVSSSEDEINLLDYLIAILKHKKLVMGLPIAAVVISVVASLLIPSVYRAETLILPSGTEQTGMAAELMGNLGDLGLKGLEKSNTNDLYAGIIKSRTIFDRIIDRFHLLEVYQVEYRQDARARLDEAVETDSSRDEMLAVTVEDQDPERAAAMANAFVEELSVLVKGLALTEASRRRLFLEEQLLEAKGALIWAEEEMARFQQDTGAMKIDNQAEAIIQAIADLKARIAEKEVQLKVMKTYSTASNPDVQKLNEELKELRAQRDKLEQGRQEKGYEPLMPMGKMTEVGTEYWRKLRDQKINETLYEVLLKQYETARLDEANDAVLLQIIDKAVAPEKRARPKRTKIVIFGLLGGIFLGILSALLADYKERALQDPERRAKFEKIKTLASLKK